MKSGILKTILLRFFSSLLTLFLLISFLFVLIRLSPGNPTDKYISAKLGSELSDKIFEKFSLNQPIADQYFAFVTNVFKGDLGISYNYRQPVFEIIWEYFSFTLVFAITSIILQIGMSIWLSVWVIKWRSKLLDNFISNSAILVYSIPAFVLGVALIYIFSVEWNLFPISGLHSLDFENFSFFGKVIDTLHHLFLPLITLTAAGVAMFYKYTKDSMDEVLSQTFITNLVSSGLESNSILKKHVIPNSLRPIISVAGVELGILLGGTLITEVIFSLPGMGRLTIDSILSRDYPLVIGCVFTAGAVMIIANFLADIFKLKLDKRLLKGILN
ncbi:MAG: ABC transporter permease [bacterium]|nr:ABC transporter permease [bacterium]